MTGAVGGVECRSDGTGCGLEIVTANGREFTRIRTRRGGKLGRMGGHLRPIPVNASPGRLPGEFPHHGPQGEIEAADDERHAEQPRGGGMHAGPAKALQESRGVVPEGMDERGDREWHGRGAPDFFADPHVDQDEHELQGAQDLVEGLQNGLVEPQPQADPEVQERGKAEEREQGTRGAHRKREGEFIGGDALGQLSPDGADEAALPE